MSNSCNVFFNPFQMFSEYTGSLTQANPVEADAYTYFCFEKDEDYFYVNGISYLGTICRTGNDKRYRTNIVEYNSVDILTAEVHILVI